jgi:DNA-binding response OmpR family regulator
MSGLDWNSKINLTSASVLAVDRSAQGLTMLDEVLRGFGVGARHLCASANEARKAFEANTVDLVVVDVGAEEGAHFLSWARRSGIAPNNVAPVIATMGHVSKSDLERVRDCGANFVLTKPLKADVLLQRIQWIARENRPFVETPSYVGPDRRFRNMGPPPGKQGRRADDLSLAVGDAQEPNMDQAEIDNLFKPQRVQI